MSIRATSGSRRHQASEASGCNSTCVAAGRQIHDFARLRSGDDGLPSTTRCQLDGSRRELLGWSAFGGSAKSLEEGSFPARVLRQLYVALHSRAEAPRLRRYLGTVLGRGPRQNLFWSGPSLLPKSGTTTTNALHPRPKSQQSQKCLKVNKIHYFSQIISIIVIVWKVVRFGTPGVKYFTGTIILPSNNLGSARFFIRV